MESIEHQEHALQEQKIEPHPCWPDEWKKVGHRRPFLMGLFSILSLPDSDPSRVPRKRDVPSYNIVT